MQLLSSRAAQACTYTCTSCAARLNSPIRRTSITAYRLRKPNLDEISAAFYTTALASATAPGVRPRSTWRNGPKKLLRVSRRIAASLRQASSLVTQDDRTVAGLLYNPVETLSSICKTQDSLARHEESNHAYRAFLRDLYKLYDSTDALARRPPHYPGPSMAALDRAIKEERMHFVDHREPMTDYQLEKYHEMINRLVDDLVKQAYFDEFPDDPELARRNFDSLDSAWTAIRLLRSEGYPQYTPPQFDPIAAKEARNKLSETIDSLFEMNQDRRNLRIKPKFQVAKICYNLLVCKFPPTIHHYNALILGFHRQDMPNLVDLVAASLLQDSRLRSTMQTSVCLLAHYRKTRDIQGFFSIIRRLMGVDSRGMLRTRRRLYGSMNTARTVRSWPNDHEVVLSHQGQWAVELPERTQEIYEAVIFGLLAFDRTKDAVKVLLASLQEGVGVSLALLIDVFQLCLYRLNTRTTDILACGMLDHIGIPVRLLGPGGPRYMAEHLYSLLSVAQPIQGTISEERAQIGSFSRWMFISHNHGGDARLLTTAIFIRQAERKLKQLDHILAFADRLNSTTSPKHRRNLAIITIQRLEQLVGKDAERAKRVLKRRKLFRLVDTLERATWGLKTRGVLNTHRKIVRILARKLPIIAEVDSPLRWEHVEQLEQVADHWFRYRLRKKEDIVGSDNRLMVEVELSLYYGERLMDQVRRWTAPFWAWKGLAIQSPQETYAWEPEQADGDNVAKDEGMWPRARARARAEADWLRPGSGLQLN